LKAGLVLMTELSQSDILSWIVFLPLLGALLLAFLPSEGKKLLHWAALLSSMVTFVVSLSLLAGFETGRAEMQFVVNRPWIENWGISYHLGIDGISLFLVLLTTFITPVVVLSTWSAVKEKVKSFMILLLLLECGMVGAFVALDMVLFYIFWEVMLLSLIHISEPTRPY